MLQSINQLLQSNMERVLVSFAILFTAFVAARIIKILMDRFQKKNKHLADHMHFNFLKHFTVGAIYLLGIGFAVYMIPALRAFSVSILAGAGVIAIIIGFASQQAFSNVVSGIFIAIFEPFRVGDRIKFSDVSGIVEDINLRHTVVRTFENKRVIVPNSVISNEKIENANLTDEKTVRFVDFHISYDSDIDKAMKIMAQEIEKHPFFIDNRDEESKKNGDPLVPVRVIGFGDSSINLRAFAWAEDPRKAWVMGCDLNRSIKLKFDKAKIEIPFPYRTIVHKEGKIRSEKK